MAQKLNAVISQTSLSASVGTFSAAPTQNSINRINQLKRIGDATTIPASAMNSA